MRKLDDERQRQRRDFFDSLKKINNDKLNSIKTEQDLLGVIERIAKYRVQTYLTKGFILENIKDKSISISSIISYFKLNPGIYSTYALLCLFINKLQEEDIDYGVWLEFYKTNFIVVEVVE